MGFLDALGSAAGGIIRQNLPQLPDWAQGLAPALAPALSLLPGASPPPGGYQFSVGGPQGIAFTKGAPLPPTNGGPLFPSNPGTGLAPSPDPFAILNQGNKYSAIRQKMIDQLGFAPRRKTVMFMLRRMGADFTATALGLDQSDILWLYTHRRSGSRRHFLQTYTKWIARGERAKRQLAPLARRAVRAAHRSGGHARRRARAR